MKKCLKCLNTYSLIYFFKNKTKKDGHATYCKFCNKLYLSSTKESKSIYDKNYRELNKKSRADYVAIHREDLIKYNKEKYLLNKEKSLENSSLYFKRNPQKRRTIDAKSRARKLLRVPKWLTKEHLAQIEIFYTDAKHLELATGIKYEVDHIIPLRGKLVSGLHVPWNLQILTKHQNRIKSNKVINV